MKYFYIITFDNQIFEIPFTEEKLNGAIQAWKNGSILAMSDVGGGIHGNSIAKVLNEENYESYTYNVKPKIFIKDGTWYDGAERKMVRREKWKQDILDEKEQQLKLSERKEPAEIKALFDKYRPKILKNTKL